MRYFFSALALLPIIEMVPSKAFPTARLVLRQHSRSALQYGFEQRLNGPRTRTLSLNNTAFDASKGHRCSSPNRANPDAATDLLVTVAHHNDSGTCPHFLVVHRRFCCFGARQAQLENGPQPG